MIRTDTSRIESKKRILNHRKQQFSTPQWKDQTYPHRLNFYTTQPTADITLEQFESWAIDRLKVLAELEACSFRNKTPEETRIHMKDILDKYLPLNASSSSAAVGEQRKKDHYSHFILRLAFAATETLRQRFVRIETQLFALRWQQDDARERREFTQSLELDWDVVGEGEKEGLREELLAASGARGGKREKEVWEEGWFKVDWMMVPELVAQRKVLVRGGWAYVPGGEQMSMVVHEFEQRLEKAMEVRIPPKLYIHTTNNLQLTARGLPRIDEDDRLTPILTHLSSTFLTPASSAQTSFSTGDEITASSIPSLTSSFPLCMSTLAHTLSTTHHLKHYARLQYTLFLKGLGLSLPEALQYWRSNFTLITDDTFNKEYRYNIRHAYGDVGGDSIRRSGGYAPFSCQKILTEHAPGPGEQHGCPYRHYSMEALKATLGRVGVTDRDVVRGVEEDRNKLKFHMACNRVFEHVHARELREAREKGIEVDKETITHPNEYFKRSFLLKNLGKAKVDGQQEE